MKTVNQQLAAIAHQEAYEIAIGMRSKPAIPRLSVEMKAAFVKANSVADLDTQVIYKCLSSKCGETFPDSAYYQFRRCPVCDCKKVGAA